MKTILLLEDDFDLAMQWKTALELAGYRVFHESSVDPAIAILKEFPVDLVVSDMLIGSSSGGYDAKGGLSLLSFISLYIRPKPKTVAITGAKSSLALDRIATQLRADSTLLKPVSDVVLVAEVNSYFKEVA